jgi:hypothetical protein
MRYLDANRPCCKPRFDLGPRTRIHGGWAHVLLSTLVLLLASPACRPTQEAPGVVDAGIAACADYRALLVSCRGSGPMGAEAVAAQDSLVEQLSRAPGGAAVLEQRCSQLAQGIRADPGCASTVGAGSGGEQPSR